MNREDIIRMAKEADDRTNAELGSEWSPDRENLRDIYFAALVAAAEREACELTVDSLIISGPVSEVQQRHNWAYMHARDAIRARDET